MPETRTMADAEREVLDRLSAELDAFDVPHARSKSSGGTPSTETIWIPDSTTRDVSLSVGYNLKSFNPEVWDLDRPFVTVAPKGDNTHCEVRLRAFQNSAESAAAWWKKAVDQRKKDSARAERFEGFRHALESACVFSESRKRLDEGEVPIPAGWTPRIIPGRHDSETSRLEIAFLEEGKKYGGVAFSIPFPFFVDGIRKSAFDAPVSVPTVPARILPLLAAEVFRLVREAETALARAGKEM